MLRRWSFRVAGLLVCGAALAQPVTLESVFVGVPFVKNPTVTHQPDVIPAEKLRRLGSGTVVVAVLVGEDGAPLRYRILSAEPPLLFDRYVTDALPEFRFAPGSRHGAPQVYETRLTMQFKPLK